MHVLVSRCGYVHIHVWWCLLKPEGSDPLKLELQVLVSNPLSVLGTKRVL